MSPVPLENPVAAINLLDELHLTVRVPDDLPEGEIDAIRRTLARDEFLDQLRRAVEETFGNFPELSPCHVTLTR